MEGSEKAIAQAKTQIQGNGTDAILKSKDKGNIYFEISTGYYYVVDADSATAIEDENNRLQHLIEQQINASKNFADIQEQCLVEPKNEALIKRHKELQQTLFDTNKNLKDGINYLEPMQISDDNKEQPHSLSEISKNTEKLVELLPIRKSKSKVIYVRPSLNGKPWKPYIPEQQEKGPKSFIRDGKLDKQELHKQLKSVSAKIKKDWDIIDPKDHTGTLFDWADKWNKMAHAQLHDEKDQSPTDNFDASAGAQLMRYTAGLGANLEFDLLEKQAQAKVSGSAEFALWEGKANFKVMFPHRLGWLPSVPKRGGGDCVLGYFRLDLEVVATSSVGASLTAELGITINQQADNPEKAGIKGTGSDYKPTPPPGERKVDLTKVPKKPRVKGGIRAFAGVEAKGGISGSIMWKEPEKMFSRSEDDYKAIAKVGESTSYLAGVGFEGTFEIDFTNGRFYITCHASLCWGMGAGGGIDFEVDAGLLFDFLKYIYYLLRDADYQKIAVIISEYAYKNIMKLTTLVIVENINFAKKVYKSALDFDEALETYLDNKKRRLDFIEKISSDRDLCRYSTPEVKGYMLAMLTEEDFVDAIADMWNNNRVKLNQGVMNIFRWVQSKSEYRNVMQHCSLVLGEKKYPDWELKHKRLVIRMYFGDSASTGNGPLSLVSDGYGKAFEAIYPALSEEPMAGYPFIPNDSYDYKLAVNSINHSYYPNQALS